MCIRDRVLNIYCISATPDVSNPDTSICFAFLQLSLIHIFTGAEQFLEGMKAVQAGIDATDALIDCVTGCSKALDNFDFDLSTESDAKLELFKELQSHISDLTLSYSTSGNKTIDAAVKLANSGVSAAMNAITELSLIHI